MVGVRIFLLYSNALYIFVKFCEFILFQSKLGSVIMACPGIEINVNVSVLNGVDKCVNTKFCEDKNLFIRK